jgi:thermitase
MSVFRKTAITLLLALMVYGGYRYGRKSDSSNMAPRTELSARTGDSAEHIDKGAEGAADNASANDENPFGFEDAATADDETEFDPKAQFAADLTKIPPVEKVSVVDFDNRNKDATLYNNPAFVHPFIMRVVPKGVAPAAANSAFRIADRFMVTLDNEPTKTLTEQFDEKGVFVVSKMFDNVYVVGFKNVSIQRHFELFRWLKTVKGVRAVGMDGVEFASAQQVPAPSDPFYPLQWYLENHGVGPDKRRSDFVKGLDTHAVEAWSVSADCSAKVVAIIDTGVDVKHPDLVSNLDLMKAKNFAPRSFKSADATVDADGIADRNGHGTHVAGIIAARGDDSKGVSGICWKARVLPVRCMDDNGLGSSEYTTRALEYALKSGANIINMSIQSDTPNPQQESLMTEAMRKGIIVVTAAGNYLRNVDQSPVYPGAYPWTINVANTKGNNELNADNPSLPAGSNYGVESVDIAAPGTAILSTYPRGMSGFQGVDGYRILSGTSQASPMVAGALALAWSAAPAAPAQAIVEMLFSSASKNNTISGKVAEKRQLDIGAFVRLANETGGKSTKCHVSGKKDEEKVLPSEAHCQTYCEVIGPLLLAQKGSCKSDTKTYYEAVKK